MYSLRNQDLLIASGNVGKLAEFSQLLAPYGTRILSLRDFGLDEPEETEVSFVGNARLKAMAAAVVSGVPSLADDSGLRVQALGGAPGIYTADWAERTAGRDFDHAMAKTWNLLRSMGGRLPWEASFHCCLVLALPGGADLVFAGQLDGQIVWPGRGLFGHGYDPIFQPDGHEQTMGELAPAVKNQISHRAHAVGKFVAACFT